MAGKVPGNVVRQRQFRILALPLARIPRTHPSHSAQPSPTPNTSTSASASQSPPHGSAPSSSSPPSSQPKTPILLFHVSQPDPSSNKGPPSLSKRALTKASDMWLKLGEKDKTTWTYWFYKKGESLMDRIEYEEWALKAITEGQGVKIVKDGESAVQEKIEIPLLSPKLPDQPMPPLLPKLHRLLIHRIPYHRKMMYQSLIFSPLTWPFAIIPVVPNFPLFYVLWRAWSHYKAWRGALYLENLLKLGMIVDKPSKELDEVYASTGIVIEEKGSENLAPDGTTSVGVKKGVISENKAKRNLDMAKEIERHRLPSQARVEQVAPDGTATPDSMVFESKHSQSQSLSTTPSVQETQQRVKPGPQPTTRHPALLLGLKQVPILARAFDLRANEVMDINRAVEQAEQRARAADKAREGHEGQVQGQVQAQTQRTGKDGEKQGTSWRGNLHR